MSESKSKYYRARKKQLQAQQHFRQQVTELINRINTRIEIILPLIKKT